LETACGAPDYQGSFAQPGDREGPKAVPMNVFLDTSAFASVCARAWRRPARRCSWPGHANVDQRSLRS
jgi:hypothetical protein